MKLPCVVSPKDMTSTAERYSAALSVAVNNQVPSGKELLQRAYDIRKFEIEMYWKRSSHFWLFTSATIAGHVATLKYNDASDGIREFHPALNLAILGLGFLSSLAWFFANHGSKRWFENWERHVDILEARFGYPPMLGLVLGHEPSGCLGGLRKCLSEYSVTRLNEMVSATFVLVLALLWSTWLHENYSLAFDEWRAVDGVSTVLVCGVLLISAATICCCRSSVGTHRGIV